MAKFTFTITDSDNHDSVNVTCTEFVISEEETKAETPAALIVAGAFQELTSGEHSDLINTLYGLRLAAVRAEIAARTPPPSLELVSG
jgi:hypothetical protein